MSILTREQQEAKAIFLQEILNLGLKQKLFVVKYDHCSAHLVYCDVEENRFQFWMQPNWRQTQTDFEKNGELWNISDGARFIKSPHMHDHALMEKIAMCIKIHGFILDERYIKKTNLREADLQQAFLQFVECIKAIQDLILAL